MTSPTKPHSPFPLTLMSMSELRQPAKLVEHLKSQPYVPVSLERYNAQEGIVVAPELWDVLMGLVTGTAQVFHVPSELTSSDGPPPKLVVGTLSSECTDTFNVFVDWMPYTLSVPTDEAERLKPDYAQLIWKHHADVARQVLARFNRSHSREAVASREPDVEGSDELT
jgi:hypothetical protein